MTRTNKTSAGKKGVWGIEDLWKGKSTLVPSWVAIELALGTWKKKIKKQRDRVTNEGGRRSRETERLNEKPIHGRPSGGAPAQGKTNN